MLEIAQYTLCSLWLGGIFKELFQHSFFPWHLNRAWMLLVQIVLPFYRIFLIDLYWKFVV